MRGLKSYLIILLLGMQLSGCTLNSKMPLKTDDLLRFAKANCFFWYFQGQGYDIDEIGKITGGIVEMSSYSSEKFSSVAMLVKDYNPSLSSKNHVNVSLSKCFQLDTDQAFLREVDNIRRLSN